MFSLFGLTLTVSALTLLIKLVCAISANFVNVWWCWEIYICIAATSVLSRRVPFTKLNVLQRR